MARQVGRRRVGNAVLRGHRRGAPRRSPPRDRRGRFASTGAAPAGGSAEAHPKRNRRRAAAGTVVAVGAVAASQARRGSRVRTAPARRRVRRAHERRVLRDHGGMALHRGTPFDYGRARKVARAEYKSLAKHYRKQARIDRKRARKRR
ncbi:hypothetical protein Mkiyose1665_46010 [Mycobacterium kiyosense]|uniref:Uncharacterized protein n=1 Tax=Mycobacterium kiyosense TaxID=2871094 RepID=A0A9P3Q7I1_9MYCO|nr:hypothetical protein IWGMT90018_15690 [Mycobacterium kiyosense]BDE12913.1 hypothetical protein MKCMC460_17730 [Mycobacterium sp. 20KCMC460]GLB83644.1 hypothetical protein SRL2020028_29000 [Mycobacterium kiyosense]GLB91505.1 hypothetical protein SRL2020130_43220 [Mycobacterium kiyosense]GLB97474.1 hypothetical protein SRL2020226_42500 [Mycobacterium kiyosense]